MLSSRVWCSRVSCASPWGSPDRGARHMSSWGIRMELLRIVTRGIAHSTRGGILSGRLSTFSGYLTSGIPSAIISPSPDISQPDEISYSRMGDEDFSTSLVRHVRILWSDISYPDISQPDGKGGRFNFPGQTCLDLLIVLTRKASATDNLDSPDSHFCTVQRNFSSSFLIFSTDILRYFALDIWCLNPQTLLVTHLS